MHGAWRAWKQVHGAGRVLACFDQLVAKDFDSKGFGFRVSRYGLCQTRCRLPELCWLESFHLQVPTLCVCTHDKDACKFWGGHVGVAHNKGYLFWGPYKMYPTNCGTICEGLGADLSNFCGSGGASPDGKQAQRINP